MEGENKIVQEVQEEFVCSKYNPSPRLLLQLLQGFAHHIFSSSFSLMTTQIGICACKSDKKTLQNLGTDRQLALYYT